MSTGEVRRVEPGSAVEYVGPFGTVTVEMDHGGRGLTITAPGWWKHTPIPTEDELRLLVGPKLGKP